MRTNHLAWFGTWRTYGGNAWVRVGIRDGMTLTVEVAPVADGSGWTWRARGVKRGEDGAEGQRFLASGTSSGTAKQAQRRAMEAAAALVEQARVTA